MDDEKLVRAIGLREKRDRLQRDINQLEGIFNNYYGELKISPVLISDTAVVRSVISTLKQCLLADKKLVEEEYKSL